jgi:hypothetical protein
MDDYTTRSHEDIYKRQQATDINIARMDGKIDNILQMLTLRAEQAALDRNASDKLVSELRHEHAAQCKAVWEKIERTDTAIDRMRVDTEAKFDEHKKNNSDEVVALTKQIGKLDGKLLAVGGGISLLSFILVLFAPIIQQQFLRQVPANSRPAHYELRQDPSKVPQ